MKIVEPTLLLELTQSLDANLQGLTKKHTRQMQRKVASAVKKLAQNFAHLLAKEQRTRDKQQHKATKVSIQNLVVKLHEVLVQPTAHASRRAGTHAA